jgi:hypothetical protein
VLGQVVGHQRPQHIAHQLSGLPPVKHGAGPIIDWARA